jgi:hypothetical protein
MNEEGKRSCLPTNIVDVFKKISVDITWLHARWIIYKQLFGISQKRIDLLFSCAPAFFYLVHQILLDDMLLALNRLAEPADKPPHGNLSLEQIAIRLRDDGHKVLIDSLYEKLEVFREQCRPFAPHRHKRIAHRDLRISLNSDAEPLPGISRQMIDDALASVRDYMNTVEGHFCNSKTAYDYFGMIGDADALISHLAEGLRYEELRRSGSLRFDDMNKSKWHDA